MMHPVDGRFAQAPLPINRKAALGADCLAEPALPLKYPVKMTIPRNY
jgi:hypothetical protein